MSAWVLLAPVQPAAPQYLAEVCAAGAALTRAVATAKQFRSAEAAYAWATQPLYLEAFRVVKAPA